MSHIFKPVTVKVVPRNAVLVTVKGQRVARWTNRKHKPVTAALTADGTKCRVESPIWWIEYTNANQKRERVKGFPSREATQHLATDLERTANSIRAGHELPRHESPDHLVNHLPAFQEQLEFKGRSSSHVTSVLHNLRAVITGVKLTTPAKVDCELVTSWLAGQRLNKKWSNENFNRYVIFLRQFGKWMVKTKRARHNPFDGLERLESSTEKTRTRRRLADDELAWLIGTTKSAQQIGRGRPRVLTGPDRARLYLIAAFTGFRIGTLARLAPEAFTWEGRLPIGVTAGARLTKNKKAHTVPLHPDVAAELADWLRGRTSGQPIFPPGDWSRRGAELVASDLTAARAAWIAAADGKAEHARRLASDTLCLRNSAGDVFDFHALRVQFISGLAIAKVPLTAAQQLADHSTPTLTANIYTKWGPQELASEVAKLPGLRGLGSELQSIPVQQCPTKGNRPKRAAEMKKSRSRKTQAFPAPA